MVTHYYFPQGAHEKTSALYFKLFWTNVSHNMNTNMSHNVLNIHIHGMILPHSPLHVSVEFVISVLMALMFVINVTLWMIFSVTKICADCKLAYLTFS